MIKIVFKNDLGHIFEADLCLIKEPMKTKILTFLGCLSLALGATPMTQAQSSFLKVINKQDLVKTGKQAYHNRCASCHGEAGNGKGPGAVMLDPKPRDFTKGLFKFKSTPIGAMPTNDDLLKTINQGIPGTSMPSFRLVSEYEKKAIVEYIKSFAAKEWEAQSQDLVVPPLRLPKGVFTKKAEFLKYAARGRAWYQELGCVSCHGASGKGDGGSAKTLQDNWGDSISPANFYNNYVKRGFTIQDVAYSIMMGVDGTPMPAHGDMLESLEEKFPEVKEKQFIWDLAAYVFYLRGVGAGLYDDELKPIPKTGIPSEEVQAVIGKYLE